MPHRLFMLRLQGASAIISHPCQAGERSGPSLQKVLDDLLAVVSQIDKLIRRRRADPHTAATIPELVRAREKISRVIALIPKDLSQGESGPGT